MHSSVRASKYIEFRGKEAQFQGVSDSSFWHLYYFQAAELQEEHKTIIDGLKSQITSIANVAVSAEPQVLTAATPVSPA